MTDKTKKIHPTTKAAKRFLIFLIIVALFLGFQFLNSPISSIDLEFAPSEVVANTVTSRFRLKEDLAKVKIIKRYRDDNAYVFVAGNSNTHYLVAYKKHSFLPMYSINSCFPISTYPFAFSITSKFQKDVFEISTNGIRLI